MREVSERPEAIAAGTACLTGTDSEGIVGAVSSLLDDPDCYERMTSHPNPYGDGHAAERIVQFLISRVTSLPPLRYQAGRGSEGPGLYSDTELGCTARPETKPSAIQDAAAKPHALNGTLLVS
jgi:hypothetical protein